MFLPVRRRPASPDASEPQPTRRTAEKAPGGAPIGCAVAAVRFRAARLEEIMAEGQIGFLSPTKQGYLVVGDCCAVSTTRELASPVYRINVYPYAQHCADCGRVLVQPGTPKWPELFDGGEHFAAPYAELTDMPLFRKS
jgi:hypothetical protein